MSSPHLRSCLGMLCLLVGHGVKAEKPSTDHWPQFRGPSGQGLTAAAELPLHWTDEQNIVWQARCPGEGHSSPVVWGTQIWITKATSDGSSLGAACLDLEAGEVVHDLPVFHPDNVHEIHSDNTYASPTPVIEDGRLYVHYGRYGTACVDTQSGEVLWRNTENVIDHQGGPGSSPVLWRNYLILSCDGADAQYVVALETSTGRTAWKQLRSEPYRENPIYRRAFSTPLLLEHDGQPLVICPGADQLQAYHPETGQEVWSLRYVGFSNVPAPVSDGEQVFICTGFFSPELWSVRLGGTGNVTSSHLRWKVKGAVPEVPSPLVVGNRLYLVSNKGIATCYDTETGNRLWIKRLGGNHSASPLSDGAHVYFFSEEGDTNVIAIGDEPKLIACNHLPGAIKASPAVAGSSLIIRTDSALYRIQEP